ncbi:MAG: hypothetical protein ACYC2H_01980 [Thermoplasmatota archaeon]
MKNDQYNTNPGTKPMCLDATKTPCYGRAKLAAITMAGRATEPAFRSRNAAHLYRGTTYGHPSGGR